jgi:hypothetical protein
MKYSISLMKNTTFLSFLPHVPQQPSTIKPHVIFETIMKNKSFGAYGFLS